MNRYAGLNEPQDSLDFHDRGRLDAQGVKRLTEAFVRAAHARGHRLVRIVTGKGIHSGGPPLVGPQVARTLEALRREGIVERFAQAKVFEGDAGAVDVHLAPLRPRGPR
jgi:DNA-nicking Smr family endonuclease